MYGWVGNKLRRKVELDPDNHFRSAEGFLAIMVQGTFSKNIPSADLSVWYPENVRGRFFCRGCLQTFLQCCYKIFIWAAPTL